MLYVNTPFSLVRERKVDSLPDTCETDCSSCLFVHQFSKSSLSLDDAVGHTHLTTEGRQKHYNLRKNEQKYQICPLSRVYQYLDGVHIVRYGNQSCFLLFNQVGNMIYTILQRDWLLL